MKTVHISTNIRVNLMEYRDLFFFYMNLQMVFGGGGLTYIRENTVSVRGGGGGAATLTK